MLKRKSKFEVVEEKLPQQKERDKEWIDEQIKKMKEMGLYCGCKNKGTKEKLEERKKRLAKNFLIIKQAIKKLSKKLSDTDYIRFLNNLGVKTMMDGEWTDKNFTKFKNKYWLKIWEE